MSTFEHPIPEDCHCCDASGYKSMEELLYDEGGDSQSHHLLYVIEKKMFIHASPSTPGSPGNVRYLCEDLRDTYICTNAVCKHIYRNYFEDISDFHEGGGLRTNQSVEGTELLDMGTQEKIKLKTTRAIVQLGLVRAFLNEEYSVLEIAPGRGFFLKVAKEYFNPSLITGVDIDPKVVAHNKILYEDIDIKLCNVLELPEDKKYDMIFAFDVLEHVEELNGFVSKIHALTNKYAVIQVPVDRPIIPPNYHLLENPKEHQVPFDGHLHYFSEFSLNNLFTKNDMFKCIFMYKTFPGETASGRELLVVFEKIEV